MTWRRADLPLLDVRRDAAEVVASLDPSRLAILAGAGISVPSALPSAASFLRSFYRAALPSSCDPELYASAAADLRFEAVVDVVQQRFDRSLDILDLYASAKPNLNHLRLDRVARRGALILTTNFDSLIESADYSLRIFDRDFHQSPFAAPELWHLHGALVDARSGESTRASITASIRDCWRSRDLFERDGAKATMLKRALESRALLVLGYSGADDYDIAPALERIASARRLIWAQHTPADGAFIRDDGVTPLRSNVLPDGTSWYHAPAANSLATMIANRTRDAANVFLLAAETGDVLSILAGDVGASARETVDVDAFFREWSVRHLTSELSPYLLALTLCRIGGLGAEQQRLLAEAGRKMAGKIEINAANAEETVRTAAEIQQSVTGSISPMSKVKQTFWRKLRQPALLAAELTVHGRALLGAGAIDDAIDAFRQSLNIRRKLHAMPNLDAAEHDLALALFQKGYPTGDLEDAAEQIVRTAVAARDAGNPEGLARAYLLRGRVSERVGLIDDARKSYETAHAAAVASGQEGLIATCEGELGLCLWSEGLDPAKAARLLAGAFRVHLRRQEWREVQLIGSNLADCLGVLGEHGRSLLAHCSVFQCATKLGDRETAAIAADRIRSALPALHMENVSDDVMVVAVRKQLLDDGWLI